MKKTILGRGQAPAATPLKPRKLSNTNRLQYHGAPLLATLWVALGAISLGGGAVGWAQGFDLPQEAPLYYDYYLRNTDHATYLIVKNVELYHLSEDTFWRWYRAGDLKTARGGPQFVLDHVPNHPTALYLMGLISIQLGEKDHAITYYERALRAYPQYAYTRAQFGHYLVQIGHAAAGRQYLEEALEMDPTLLVARAWLATDGSVHTGR